MFNVTSSLISKHTDWNIRIHSNLSCDSKNCFYNWITANKKNEGNLLENGASFSDSLRYREIHYTVCLIIFSLSEFKLHQNSIIVTQLQNIMLTPENHCLEEFENWIKQHFLLGMSNSYHLINLILNNMGVLICR